jgi:peptidoglycan/LPS O-acetylase OafA/YrhL/lysophospholipase L1-like esterase
VALHYRPEIDGLRAIAVSAVVLYHAEFAFPGADPFQGGFIGVDIFFVISGYLITSILLRGLKDGNFRISHFYERRARRILPALFCVMLASVPFAWALMLPRALKDFAGSGLSALLFSSNVWFWQEESYWAAPSALKPFLHSWTLSLEEQFYLIFPIVLLLLWRYAQQHILGIFVLAFLLSLHLADTGATQFVDASFYLLPTRAWELLGGAILARCELQRGRTALGSLDSALAALGLFLVAWAIGSFDSTTPHPSVATLLPVAGTMAIIWFAKPGAPVTRLLGSRAFVGVGLVSYSLYLWHFPVFAFARISEDALTNFEKAGLIGVAVALAITTFFLIERPARNAERVGRRVFAAAGLAAFALLFVSYAGIYAANGVPGRFGQFAETLTEEPPADFGIVTSESRKADLGSIIVVGDSHANTLSPHTMRLATRYGYSHQSITMNSCPFVDVEHVIFGECDDFRKEAQRVLDDAPPSIIFFVVHWRKYTDDSSGQYQRTAIPYDGETLDGAYRRTFARLIEAGHTLVLVYPGFESDRHLRQRFKEIVDDQPPAARSQFAATLKLTSTYSDELARAVQPRRMLDSTEAGPRLVKVDPLKLFCSAESDTCALNDGVKLYLLDTNHYSGHASKILVAEAERQLVAVGALAQDPGEPTNAAEAALRDARAEAELDARYRAWVGTLSPARQAWEGSLQSELGDYYLQIHKRQKLAGESNAWDFVADDPALPRVLLIGDSVSRAYTQTVRNELAGKANVHRAPANCGPTANGLKKLDTWLGDGEWDFIYFNFGIHDRDTPVEDYESRLARLVERMQKTGATLIWANTTPVPDLPHKGYTARSIVDRNAAAARVMAEHDIAVDDLFGAVSPHLSEFQRPGDCHFNELGNSFLGETVARFLAPRLARRNRALTSR